MTLKEILAISGQSGLYKLIASSRTGLIVESIENGKRMPVSSTTRVSSLEDIAIFTLAEDKPLSEILKTIKEKQLGQPAMSHKSDSEKIKLFFSEILPEYDPARVYISDMKKVINWYNELQANNMLDILEQKEETEATVESEEK